MITFLTSYHLKFISNVHKIYNFPQELCIKQAQVLNMKSSLVEEAANELINMLLEFDNNQKVEGEKKEEVESSAECEGM